METRQQNAHRSIFTTPANCCIYALQAPLGESLIYLTIVKVWSAQQWFNRWLDQLRNDYPERSQRAPHFISWQTHEDINLTVNGFCGLTAHLCQPSFTSQHFAGHFIIPKRLSQDIIESHFSQQRGGCGGNQNMTAYAYSYNNQRLMCTRVARKQKRKTMPWLHRKENGIKKMKLPPGVYPYKYQQKK